MSRVFFGILCLLAFPANAADWQPRYQVKTYAVSGTTAPELYAAIGQSGPKIGLVRTIAHTNWDIKWRRNYVPEGKACVLKSATPILIITTTLPKPMTKFTGSSAALWKVFIDGITTHEKVHGADIVAMVDEIIGVTVGLRVDNDPQCKAIRTRVLALVTTANETYKAKSRNFDKVEMSPGGTVQQLVLALVNGQ